MEKKKQIGRRVAEEAEEAFGLPYEELGEMGGEELLAVLGMTLAWQPDCISAVRGDPFQGFSKEYRHRRTQDSYDGTRQSEPGPKFLAQKGLLLFNKGKAAIYGVDLETGTPLIEEAGRHIGNETNDELLVYELSRVEAPRGFMKAYLGRKLELEKNAYVLKV